MEMYYKSQLIKLIIKKKYLSMILFIQMERVLILI